MPTPDAGDGHHFERVVLLDDRGRAIGSELKSRVHHRRTPLHLAFSCYVFDREGHFLVTQRSPRKPTWPGVWTNTLCGHPGVGEELGAAVRRRADQELGMRLVSLRLLLPRYRYQATMRNGLRENEVCPVFVARLAGEPRPDPSEVADAAWVPWRPFREAVLLGALPVSPWCRSQVGLLPADPWSAPAADPGRLPAAARLAQPPRGARTPG